MYFNHVIEAVGHTPLVRLNKVTDGIKGTVLAKVEYFNPGNLIDLFIGKPLMEWEKVARLGNGGAKVGP